MENLLTPISDFLEEIKSENEQLKYFQIPDPPKSSFNTNDAQIDLDRYVEKPVNEVYEISRNSEGGYINLNDEQKRQLRTKGTFEVDSKKYPGQKHKWVIKFLQKGTENIKEDFYNGLAKSYTHLLEAKNYLKNDKNVNVYSGIKSIANIPYKLFETLFGVKMMKNEYTELKREVAKLILESYDKDTDQLTLRNGDIIYTFDTYEKTLRRLEPLIRERNPQTEEEYQKLFRDNLPDEQLSESLLNFISSLKEIRREIDAFYTRKRNDIEAYKNQLTSNNYIKARSHLWMNNMIQSYEKRWDSENSLDDVISRINETYKIYKTYMELEKAEKAQIPKVLFTFDFEYWNPKKYYVEKERLIKTYDVEFNSKYPFWKLSWTFKGVGKVFNNGNKFLFGNLVYGKYGLRSLFGKEDFEVGHVYNANLKEIIHEKEYTPWFGRFKKLYTNISQSRQEFEDSPDTSLIGKGFTRIINKTYNYLIRGCLGTLVIAFGHPILTVVNTIGSLLLMVTSPLWSVVIGLLIYLFTIFIYDIFGLGDSKFKLFKLFFKDFLFKGVVSILSGGALSIIHVVSGMIIFSWNLFVSILRYAYDTSMYHCFLKFKARIPGGDNFLAQRVSGPDLSTEYYNLIDSDLALIIIEYELEKLAIEKYRFQVMQNISKPRDRLMEFYNQFKIFELHPDRTSNTLLSDFNDNKRILESELDKTIRKYWDNYPIKKSSKWINCRMNREELNKTIFLGTKLCEEKSLNTYDGDQLVIRLLKKATNDQIVIPIEEDNERGFEIKLEKINTKTLINKLFEGEDLEMNPTISYSPVIDDVKNIEEYKPFNHTNLFDTQYQEIESKTYFRYLDIVKLNE